MWLALPLTKCLYHKKTSLVPNELYKGHIVFSRITHGVELVVSNSVRQEDALTYTIDD